MSTTSPETWPEKVPLRREEPLSKWTTLRVGGPAEFFFEPGRPEDLAAILDRCQAEGILWRMLGGGANVLPPDEGVRGAVIHTGGMRRVFREGDGLRAWAGATLPQLVRAAAESGLSGMENLAGVPGHVGGGLAMNAGTAGWGMWDPLEEVVLRLRDGELISRTRGEVGPGYRDGNLDGAVVLEALFRLEPAPKKEIQARIESFLKRKRDTQPVTLSSAGCAFKNPPGDFSAGALVEAAGLKGAREGGILVSEKHANFLIQEGEGTSTQVVALLERMEKAVEEDSGIRLHRELVVWSA